jgi:GNAT superfamily N-acetyltransferase
MTGITLRAAEPQDFGFCEHLYFEAMAGVIVASELDIGRQRDGFVRQWRLPEVHIITVSDEDAGWLQTTLTNDAVLLGQFYLAERFRARGIDSGVMKMLIDGAARDGKAVTPSVVKNNPARRLYERLGFQHTHEDQHKGYMRFEPK